MAASANFVEMKECVELKDKCVSLILELSAMKQNHLDANAAKVGEKRKFLDAKKVNLQKSEKWQEELKEQFKNAKIKSENLKDKVGASALTQEFVKAIRYPNKQDILKLLKGFMVKMQKLQPTFIAEMDEFCIQKGYTKPKREWPKFVEQVSIRLTNIITGAPDSGAAYIKPTKAGGQFFMNK